MPVPTLISELSTTPGSNSPSGADSPSVLDDHQRTAYAFIRTLSDSKLDASSGVALTGNQTVAGVKTFSSNIVGNLNGNATNVTGTVAVANGGTGQTTALAAFNALKQPASDTYAGTQENATSAETQTGAALDRTVTPASFAASSFGYAQTPQVVTRTAGVTYTNTTGKPIFVVMYGASINALASLNVNIAGGGATTITTISPATGYQACFMVPIGATYVIGEVNISTRTTVEWR